MNSGALAAGGYKVLPDDCGPVRTVGNSGWLIRCPADVKLRRTASGVQWQSPPILPEERLLGYKTFSGMYVDLILNSGYPKLCCGLRLYYPKHIGLMMKDRPTASTITPSVRLPSGGHQDAGVQTHTESV